MEIDTTHNTNQKKETDYKVEEAIIDLDIAVNECLRYHRLEYAALGKYSYDWNTAHKNSLKRIHHCIETLIGRMKYSQYLVLWSKLSRLITKLYKCTNEGDRVYECARIMKDIHATWMDYKYPTGSGNIIIA